MGVSYRGVITVGYTYEQAFALYELRNQNDQSSFSDWADSEDLEEYAPYFYPDQNDCIYGVLVASSYRYSAVELDSDLPEKIETAQLELFQKYGENPGVYLMAEAF